MVNQRDQGSTYQTSRIGTSALTELQLSTFMIQQTERRKMSTRKSLPGFPPKADTIPHPFYRQSLIREPQIPILQTRSPREPKDGKAILHSNYDHIISFDQQARPPMKSPLSIYIMSTSYWSSTCYKETHIYWAESYCFDKRGSGPSSRFSRGEPEGDAKESRDTFCIFCSFDSAKILLEVVIEFHSSNWRAN